MLVYTIDNRTTEPMPESTHNVQYVFVDEAGDMDFTAKGSRYYMFTFLVKRRPFQLHESVANYRYDLLERNLAPNEKRLDIEAFHASYDNKYIKQALFEVMAGFDNEAVKVYSYILEKPKVMPDKRQKKDEFYISNLRYAIERLLDRIGVATHLIIITDRLPVAQNKAKQVKALKTGVKEYMARHALSCRYDLFHHCSASSVNLQLVDYISWAIFRKHEQQDDYFYQKIQRYILEEDVMTKDRQEVHYDVQRE